MKASRLPLPHGKTLPVFSSAELAGKRLRHLSGSSGSSCSSCAADPPTPAKAQRTGLTLTASRPASPLEGYASADATAPVLAALPQRPQRERNQLQASPTTATTSAEPNDLPMDTDNEDFTLVSRKKKKGKKTPPALVPSAADATTDSSPAALTTPAPRPGPAIRPSRPAVGVGRPPPPTSEFPAFRVPVQSGFATSYDAVAMLEDNNTDWKLRNIVGRDGSSVLLPLDEATFAALDAMALDLTAAVTLVKMEAKSHLTKGVVMGYPVRMPLTLLQRHPQVEEATRCVSTHRQQETRQVVICVRGSLPPQIDLGNWGVFYTRPYTPEPLRCYRCQKFGHHQASCSRPPACGVCSAAHPTQECLEKYKANQETQPRCPNCSKRHHAWNPRCPARLQRVNSGRERQAVWVQDQQRAALVPAPPGTFVWGLQKKSLQPAPATTDQDFPPLRPSAQKSVATQHSPPSPQPSLSQDTIAVTKSMMLDYANEITSAVAEVIMHAAGIQLDFPTFQDTMARVNERIVEKLFTTTRT